MLGHILPRFNPPNLFCAVLVLTPARHSSQLRPMMLMGLAVTGWYAALLLVIPYTVHTIWCLPTLFALSIMLWFPFWWKKLPMLVQYLIVIATCQNFGGSIYVVYAIVLFGLMLPLLHEGTVSRASQAFGDEPCRNRVDRRYGSGPWQRSTPCVYSIHMIVRASIKRRRLGQAEGESAWCLILQYKD